MTIKSYCQNQREAVRLVCTKCGDPYDVTNWKGGIYVCVWCQKKKPAIDVSGNPMEGGATGP